MKTYVRYFVSQHVGKAIVTVEPDGIGNGRVRIDVDLPSPRSAAFSFSLDRLDELLGGEETWPDTVARIAIHQAHQHLAERGDRGLFNATHALAWNLKPWIGDLSRVPYARAVNGHAEQDAAGRLRTDLADDS